MRYSRPAMHDTLDFPRIRAVSIDLDDTLWPVGPVIARAESALQDWLRPRAPLTSGFLAGVDKRMALRQQFVDAQPHLAHDLRAVRQGVIRAALALHGEDPSCVEPAYEAFINARMIVEPYADAVPALQWLASQFPVVALSNGNADVHRVGLGRFFRAALSAQEFGVAKPDPRIFHAAAQAVGVAPSQVLHIGDDAALDVLAALDAGMQAAWVNRADRAWKHEAVRPHLHVNDLQQLCVALEQAGARA